MTRRSVPVPPGRPTPARVPRRRAAAPRRRGQPGPDPGGGTRRLRRAGLRRLHGGHRRAGRRRRRHALPALPEQGRPVRRGGGGGPTSATARSPRRSWPTCPRARASSSSCGAASPSPAAGGPPSRRRRGGPDAGPGSTQLAPLLADILERSKAAGTVLRRDVEVTDIVIVLMAVRSIADLCDTTASRPSLRFLELALDGLRPGPAPPVHPPLSIGQLARILDQH